MDDKDANEQFAVTNAGDITVIGILAERLDLFRTPEISRRIEHVIRSRDFPDLVFDVNRISYLDSSGFGFMVAMRNLVGRHGGKAALACGNNDILRVIEVMNISRLFPVFPSVDDAVAWLES